MLSYRHAFHAGNFADVLKHTVLVHCLIHLRKKEAPFSVIDTHAGAGLYELTAGYAQKNREFDNGIGKLWQQEDLPASLTDYVATIKSFNNPKELIHYPGSPLIAQHFLRDDDRLRLFELHSTENMLLQEAVDRDKRVKVFNSDGLSGCISLLPPAEKRGLVLIDPSYEVKSDYYAVVDALINTYKRFSTGTYLLWYPVVERERIKQMEKNLQKSGIRNIQLFELGISADKNECGMNASGVIAINPPWTLRDNLQSALEYLTPLMGVQGKGHYRIEELVAE